MIRTRSILVALAVLLLAPLPLMAQGGGQGRGMGGGMMAARALLEQGSVEYLVSKAADLQLSEEQAAALKVIGAKWAEDTRASREKVRAEMPQGGMAGGGDREAMMQRLQALQPVMQKLQEDDREALAEAMKLLDETQQATAMKLIEERQPARRPPGM